MSFKKILMTASALTLLGANAFADGGPVPEPPAPPPEPAAPPPESAAPPPAPFNQSYVGVFGGVVWPADEMRFETPNLEIAETDLDMGWGVGGMFGRRWESGIRAEFELSLRYLDGEISDAFDDFEVEANAVSVMFNVLYDINLNSSLVPYLGVGVGTSKITVDLADFEDEDWAFSYQAIGGFSVPLHSSAELFVDYRYLATADLNLDQLRPVLFFDGNPDKGDEYQTHNVMAGFRYTF